jgi:hypothetical protein
MSLGTGAVEMMTETMTVIRDPSLAQRGFELGRSGGLVKTASKATR